jgi:hypothetical protein
MTTASLTMRLLRLEALAEALAGDRPMATATQLMQLAGMAPDPWQARVLQSDAQRQLLLACRQSGKSTTTACLALHTALAQPGALILLLSPSLRQSQELFRKVQDAYRALGHPAPLQAESALRCELAQGSRIISLPGT